MSESAESESASEGTRRRGLQAGVVFAVALAARALYLAEWSDVALFDVLVGDALGYDRWARELVAGRGGWDEVFYQAPLYPYLLAGLYAVAGDGPWPPRLAQALWGAASAAALGDAARRLAAPRAGWLAGLGLALFAPALYYDGLVQKTSLSLAFAVGLVWLLVHLRERDRSGAWLACGIWVGAFALVRENALIALPVLALRAAWVSPVAQAPSPRSKCLLAFGLGALLVLVPVGLRNLAIGGEFLLTTAQLGPNLYIGNHAGATGRYVPLRPGRGGVRYERADARALAERAEGRPLSPAEVSEHWRARALAWMRAHPGDFVRLLVHKLHLVVHRGEIVDTDSFEAQRAHSRWLDGLASLSHFGVIAPLAAVGLWAWRRRWRELWPLVAVPLAFGLGVAAFFVMGRYRAPLVPFALLFAALGAGAIFDAGRARRWRALVVPALLVALVGAVANAPLPRPTDPRTITYHALGLRLAELGRTREAVVWLERALEHTPGFDASRLLLGDVRRDRGELGQAEAAYRRVLARAPRAAVAAQAWSHLGDVFARRGDLDGARRAWQRALELDPDEVDANNNLANAWLREGRARDALPLYERALRARPGDPDLHANLGSARVALGRLDEAAQALDRALELAPEHAIARLTRGAVAERRGRPREALAHFRAVVTASGDPDPVTRAAWLALARIRAECLDPELGDPDAALRALARAATAFPGDPEILALRAAIERGAVPRRRCAR